MGKSSGETIYLLTIAGLDRSGTTTLQEQISSHLRSHILAGQLKPGTRLPSSRDLADLLKVSRNTIKYAFEQLEAEGFLTAQVGAGTFVSGELPSELLEARRNAVSSLGRETLEPLARRSARFMTEIDVPLRRSGRIAFRVGLPALDHFPFDVWSRLSGRHYQRSQFDLFDTVIDTPGYEPLRDAIGNYLRTARGVNCDTEQIIVTSGSVQAIYLAVNLLLDSGDQAWIEEPGYRGIRAVLSASECTAVPVPVDSEGLCVRLGLEKAPKAKMVYTTPSHQFPLGSTMSVTRRFELLDWADRYGAWILEDDYDCEYRYKGRPVAALQGLDVGGRVIYVGTFSKVLFPGIRLGYLVVPRRLVDSFSRAYRLIHSRVSPVQQAVLTDFIVEGHFSRHIRRMRTLYDGRRRAFLEAVTDLLGKKLRVGPTESGMHISAWLPGGADDNALSAAAAKGDLVATPLSQFYLEPRDKPGLVLGYTAIPADRMHRTVERLGHYTGLSS